MTWQLTLDRVCEMDVQHLQARKSTCFIDSRLNTLIFQTLSDLQCKGQHVTRCHATLKG